MHELSDLASRSLAKLSADRDPFMAVFLADLLERFMMSVGAERMATWGLIPDADHYRSFAFQVFMQRASQDGVAAKWIASYYENGWCPVERNEKEVIRWLTKAAELGDQVAIGELRARDLANK